MATEHVFHDSAAKVASAPEFETEKMSVAMGPSHPSTHGVLRVQFERIKTSQFPSVREFTRLYGLTWDRFQRCKRDVFVMHPGPMNRGIEIQSEIADGPQSGILQQVINGLAVRMAVLYLVTSV